MRTSSPPSGRGGPRSSPPSRSRTGELVEERGVSRRTANKALIVLGAILERGRKHGLVTNPAREVPKLRDRYEPSDYDFFSPAEIEKLAGAAESDQDSAIFRAAAFTGLRMGELIALCWRDIDFDGESLHVYGSYSLGKLTTPKSGLTRTVPMAERVIATLKAPKRRRPDTGRESLVFPGTRGVYLDGSAIRRRYKKALALAKLLRPLRFHDLRHTFGSIAISEANHHPSPSVDGSRRHTNDDEVHAPPQPRRRCQTALSSIPAQKKRKPATKRNRQPSTNAALA